MSNEIAKTKEESMSKTAETREEILNKAVDDFMSDKENLKRIFTATDFEEMKKIFRSVGLEVTDEQLEVFKKTFTDSMNAEINKLPAEEREKLIEKASESELEKISGGGGWEKAKRGLGNGLDTGLAIGASAGAFVGVVDFILKLALDMGDMCESPDGLQNQLWKACKTSFKRGVGTMAAVGAVTGGTIAIGGLSDTLKESSKSPAHKVSTTKNAPSTANLLDLS